MNHPLSFVGFPVFCLALFLAARLAADTPGYQPELFRKTKLVYQDSFDGPLNTDFWEVRQNTTWTIKDGVLTGSASSKEFQEKKKASDDPSAPRPNCSIPAACSGLTADRG